MAGRASGADTPPIVRVYVAGSPEAVSGSRDAIQDLCSRSNVAVVVRDAAGADEALLATSHAPGLADAYVDLREGTPPRVVVVDGESRQDLERRTLPEGASLEISIETMAHVVCSAVESSLAARAAAPPKPVPPKAPEPTAAAATIEPREPGARVRTHATLFASGANFGAGFRAGVGAGFGLSHGRARFRLGGLFSVLGYPAAGIESADGLADFGLVGLRALPLLEWQATPALTAFTGIGIGLDWIRISGERPPPGAVSSPSQNVWEPIASGILGLRLSLGSGVSALLAFDADVALVHHSYVVQTEAGTTPFFDPARVRPMAFAGLSLALGGESEARRARSEARR
jgi:hypothetical protein